MSNVHSLKRVEKLRAELESLGPLRVETEDRILQKIRVEWNYNSLSGKKNTLSLDDAKALIMHGTTKGNKPLKDYIEMKIHNETISWIFEIAGIGFHMSEDFIKQIHESILLEPYEIESLSKDGKQILKMIEIGKYKQTPNNFLGFNGKIIEFSLPEETPEKMQQLLDWFAEESQKNELNPVVLAAEFHYRFVKIQPFDDANGRIAKMLTNLILMQFNYPPIVFKSSEKSLYHFALQQADNGKMDAFVDFVARNVINSLELYLKGAKGESIEEVDHLEKELIALEQKLKRLSSKIVKREKVVLLDIFDKSILPLLSRQMDNYAKFDRFYIDKKLTLTVSSISHLNNNGGSEKKSRVAKTITHLRELLLNEPIELDPAIIVEYFYSNFNRDGFGQVQYKNRIIVNFDELEYTITEGNSQENHSKYIKKYSEELLPKELDVILNNSADAHKNFIEKSVLGADLEDEQPIKLEVSA